MNQATTTVPNLLATLRALKPGEKRRIMCPVPDDPDGRLTVKLRLDGAPQVDCTNHCKRSTIAAAAGLDWREVQAEFAQRARTTGNGHKETPTAAELDSIFVVQAAPEAEPPAPPLVGSIARPAQASHKSRLEDLMASLPEGEVAAEWSVRSRPISDYEEEELEWVWSGYIPLGMLGILAGEPKLGKSTVALDLAARVTTGAEMPDGTPGVKGDVLLVALGAC